MHTGLQKLRCLPSGSGWRPVCPLHLQLGARSAGPRRAPPRPPPPSAAETALLRSPKLVGRAHRRRPRGAALTPKVLEEKEQWHESPPVVGEQTPVNPFLPSLANFSAFSDVHFLPYFFHQFPSEPPSPSRSNSHLSALTHTYSCPPIGPGQAHHSRLPLLALSLHAPPACPALSGQANFHSRPLMCPTTTSGGGRGPRAPLPVQPCAPRPLTFQPAELLLSPLSLK